MFVRYKSAIPFVPKGISFSKIKDANAWFTSSLYFSQKMSLCDPVLKNKSVSSVSFCCHTISQSGFIWHSQHPSYVPDNLWGRYCSGRAPVSARICAAFCNSDKFNPRR